MTFELAQPGRTRLAVYDVAGRRLRTVLDQNLSPGVRTVAWDCRQDDGKRLPAGS